MPRSSQRSMFSMTTIESSTTMPTASTSPNRDRLLSENPRAHDDEGADQRHQDRDDGTDGSAPALQEQQHDHDHEQDGDEDRVDDVLDRFADKDGGIIDDLVLQAGRIPWPAFPWCRALRARRQRVGTRLRKDQERHAGPAVHERRGAVIGGADLDPADVAQPRHAALAVRLQHDGGELLGRGKPAERLHVDLVGLLGGDRRLVQDARRDLDVLGAQRGQHLARVHVVRGDLVGIEPDAHGIFAAAEDLDIADASQPRQRVLYMQRRVVRDVERVARGIGRIEMHREQDVGRRFPHLHAEPLHVVGQPGQRVLHAVLRQHLRDIEVGPDPERDGDGELAVAGRLARHVDHVLDAVDLLLERGCDQCATPSADAPG